MGVVRWLGGWVAGWVLGHSAVSPCSTVWSNCHSWHEVYAMKSSTTHHSQPARMYSTASTLRVYKAMYESQRPLWPELLLLHCFFF